MELASNSVKIFLNLNGYNHCKRLHGLLSLAFQILHYESNVPDSSIHNIKDVLYLENDSLLQLKELDNYNNYELCRLDTKMGKHGKTAKY